MTRSAGSATPEEKAFVNTTVKAGLLLLIVGQAAAGHSDSDIWGHMSIGLDMLNRHQFLWIDPYSFTSDQAWINHEWLWDVASAAVYRAGGLPALVVFRAVLAGIVLWVVDRATQGVPGWMRIVALCLVAVACAGQWRSTRPQMATLAFYAVLLSNVSAWWLPLLFVLWANTHGGWVLGFGALAFHAAASGRARSWVIAALSLAATLVNPYGSRLWVAIADAMVRGWADVSEWQPVWRLAAGVDALILWLIVAVAFAWIARKTAGEPWALGWTIVGLAAAASSRRLSAAAALSVVLLLVPRWKDGAADVRVAWTAVRRGVAGGVIAVAGAVALMTIQPSLRCFPAMPEWTNAPEAESVAFVRAAGVRRVVPHFDFGEYAIFHLRNSGVRVAIDNRRETVYSDRAVKENQRFTDGLDPQYPERIGADAVWWPAQDERVLGELAQRGWIRRFVGPRTVILTKSVGALEHVSGRTTRPCFPNP